MNEALSGRLDAYMASFIDRIDPAMARTIVKAGAALRASGVLQRVPKVGDAAPDFVLPDHLGKQVSLRSRLERGPVVLTFFRGGWCPFCALALRALDDVSREVRLAGAEIIAISPQKAEGAAATAERNDLSFPVLVDAGNHVARQYGLAWELGPELREVYGRLGHALPRINGTNDWTLPIPAGFVIGRDGKVTYAHADTDVTRRLEPHEALLAVRRAQVGETVDEKVAAEPG